MFVILTGAAAFASAIVFDQHLRRRKTLAAQGLVDAKCSSSVLLRLLMPASARLSGLVRRIRVIRDPSRIRAGLAAAGLDDVMGVETYIAYRALLVVMMAIVMTLVMSLGFFASAVLGGLAGWLYGGQWFRNAIGRRRESMERALPEALDLITLSVEAGLDFAQALARVAERLRPTPLKDELLRLNAEMRMGTPRREALARMSKRNCVPSLSSFVALLIQADRLGVGIGPVLRASSERLRRERFLRAERKGAAAAQKALFPLAFCIMPATFVVIFGPLVARLVTGGFDAMF